MGYHAKHPFSFQWMKMNFRFFCRSSVRVGEYDTSSDPDCATTGFCAPRSVNHAISHVIVHPDYKQGQYHHDIALLVLKTPLNYSGEYWSGEGEWGELGRGEGVWLVTLRSVNVN